MHNLQKYIKAVISEAKNADDKKSDDIDTLLYTIRNKFRTFYVPTVAKRSMPSRIFADHDVYSAHTDRALRQYNTISRLIAHACIINGTFKHVTIVNAIALREFLQPELCQYDIFVIIRPTNAHSPATYRAITIEDLTRITNIADDVKQFSLLLERIGKEIYTIF